MELHVAADDRTGALETAAALADRSGEPVPVAVWPDLPPRRARAAVIDLASRHVAADEAAARAAAMPAAGRVAHKIDSTLRGNWAVELASRHAAAGTPVVVLPALPALGRVCRDGVVLVDGVPVHESAMQHDPRRAPSSSRPAEQLASAGITAVGLHDRAALSAWFRAPSGIAVADAIDQADIDAVVDRWHSVDGVLLAGTSAVIAAAIGRPGSRPRRRAMQPPTLVVCGSAHPMARVQVERARERGALVVERITPACLAAMSRGTPLVVRTPAIDGPVGDEAAAAALHALVQEAAGVVESGHVGTLVVIGGDTAAALLGDVLVAVLGSVTPGTALLESLVIDVPVIARAGGFGGDDALVDLLWGAS